MERLHFATPKTYKVLMGDERERVLARVPPKSSRE